MAIYSLNIKLPNTSRKTIPTPKIHVLKFVFIMPINIIRNKIPTFVASSQKAIFFNASFLIIFVHRHNQFLLDFFIDITIDLLLLVSLYSFFYFVYFSFMSNTISKTPSPTQGLPDFKALHEYGYLE